MNLQWNLFKSRYRGLVFCIVLCEVFVAYLLFRCGMPGLPTLYSRTKMLKLIEIAKTITIFWMWDAWFSCLYSRTKMLKLRKSQTLHQKNTHFGSFCSNGLWWWLIGHFFVMESKNIFVTHSFRPYFSHSVHLYASDTLFKSCKKVLTPSILIKIIHIWFKCVVWFISIKMMYYMKVCVDYEQLQNCF